MDIKAKNDATEFEKVRKSLPKSKPLANKQWLANGGNGSAYIHPTPSIQCRPGVEAGN